MNKKEVKSVLGEGFHTAFRKATVGYTANDIWRLIKELPDEEWNAILEFVYEGIKPYLKVKTNAKVEGKKKNR